MAPPRTLSGPAADDRRSQARATFGGSKPEDNGSPSSIFDDKDAGVREKSLDEVILSYLAEDLDAPARK